MLIKINAIEQKDINKLIDIYEESNKNNVNYFYPNWQDKEQALEKIKQDYSQFIVEFLSDPKHSCYVWEEKGEWVSALRLYELKGFYYIEALETNPKYRKNGYGEKLILALMEELGKDKKLILKDSVNKNNIPSINIHKKCGFRINSDYSLDYSLEQPERDDNSYEMIYEK